MRISDWSSDVCSSDLPLRGIEGPEKTLAATETEVPATPFHPPGVTSCPARATNPFWSNPMAVQKSRVSPSRRGHRRAQDSLTAKQLSTDPTPGEHHLRHHVTADRDYTGKQATMPKAQVGGEYGSAPAPPPA